MVGLITMEYEVSSEGCWLLSTNITPKGYGRFFLDGKPKYAHRLAYEAANGSIPNGMIVRHRCDTPACINPQHLLLGTPADNSADMVERGRSARGERAANSKLTQDQVLEIRRLRSEGARAKDLGPMFGVTRQAISKICLRQRWKHV